MSDEWQACTVYSRLDSWCRGFVTCTLNTATGNTYTILAWIQINAVASEEAEILCKWNPDDDRSGVFLMIHPGI